jgi:hypothetical protein
MSKTKSREFRATDSISSLSLLAVSSLFFSNKKHLVCVYSDYSNLSHFR